MTGIFRAFAAALLLGAAAPALAQAANQPPPALLLPASELVGLVTLKTATLKTATPKAAQEGYQLTPSGGEPVFFAKNAFYRSAAGELLVPAALLREAGCLLYPTGDAVTVKCGRVSLGIVPISTLPTKFPTQ